MTAAQVVVTAQVEGEEFDPLENFVGSTYMSDEAKELSNDSEFREKYGIAALVLDTAAATSIMSSGVLQDQKRLRKSTKVSPYAGEPIVVDKEGVFFGIDNYGFMLLVAGVLVMPGDCLNLLSWPQLCRMGFELRGEGNKLSLFDHTQQCCGQFFRYENARGKKYRGLFVLNMATVPLRSRLGQEPWAKQSMARWAKAMQPSDDGQRVWANLLQVGQKGDDALDGALVSESEEDEDEPFFYDPEAKKDDACPHEVLWWETQDNGLSALAANVDMTGEADPVAHAIADSLEDMSEEEKGEFSKAEKFGGSFTDSVARENHITLETAHDRLCHAVSKRELQRLIRSGRLLGVTISKNDHISGRCMHCVMANARRGKMAGHSVVPFTRPDLAVEAESEYKYHGPLHMAADGWGPSTVVGIGDFRHISAFWVFPGPWPIVYPIKAKDSETTHRALTKALAFVEAEAGRRPTIVKTDNGTEYAGEFNQPGVDGHSPIHHMQIPPYNQQMNPAENWKSVLNPLRAAFYTSGFPLKFWSVMLGHVGQCCRRRRFKGKACTIYEFHTGKAPRFDAFRVPGCLVITVNLNVTAKLAPRGILCVWVALAKGGVLVLVLATGKLSVVRLEDCVIYEHIRPFKRETTQQLAEALAFKQIDQQDIGETEAVEWMDMVDRVYNTARVFDERHIDRFPQQGENLLEDSEVKEFRVTGVPVVTPPQMLLKADEADGVVFKDVVT